MLALIMAEAATERPQSLSKRIYEALRRRKERSQEEAGEKAKKIVSESSTGLDRPTEDRIKEETGRSVGEITGGVEQK